MINQTTNKHKSTNSCAFNGIIMVDDDNFAHIIRISDCKNDNNDNLCSDKGWWRGLPRVTEFLKKSYKLNCIGRMVSVSSSKRN